MASAGRLSPSGPLGIWAAPDLEPQTLRCFLEGALNRHSILLVASEPDRNRSVSAVARPDDNSNVRRIYQNSLAARADGYEFRYSNGHTPSCFAPSIAGSWASSERASRALNFKLRQYLAFGRIDSMPEKFSRCLDCSQKSTLDPDSRCSIRRSKYSNFPSKHLIGSAQGFMGRELSMTELPRSHFALSSAAAA